MPAVDCPAAVTSAFTHPTLTEGEVNARKIITTLLLIFFFPMGLEFLLLDYKDGIHYDFADATASRSTMSPRHIPEGANNASASQKSRRVATVSPFRATNFTERDSLTTGQNNQSPAAADTAPVAERASISVVQRIGPAMTEGQASDVVTPVAHNGLPPAYEASPAGVLPTLEALPTYELSMATLPRSAPIQGMITTSRVPGRILQQAAQRKQVSGIMACWLLIVYWAPFVDFRAH